MTAAELKFLELIKDHLKGRSSDLSSFLEWQELLNLASIHNLFPVIYEQIYKTPEFLKLPAEVREGARKRTMESAMLQTIRTEAFLQIYEGLCLAGVRPFILKGLICRQLYPRPDYRMSSDEDLLIQKEEFAICDEFLLSRGFTRDELKSGEEKDEVSYLNRNTGVYLEIHMALFPAAEEGLGRYGNLNSEFEGVFNRVKEVELDGRKIYTLSDTDHIFYLFCHALKHFLHAGFGIRQLCDIMLMAQAYRNSIDWNCLKIKIKSLELLEFFGSIVEIGDKYLDIRTKELSDLKEGMKLPDNLDLLEDLLDGGVFGSSTLGRTHSANMTLAAASGRNGFFVSLFPGREYMKQKFPFLQKYPWLYPIACMLRMWQYGKKVLAVRKSGQKIETDSVKIGRQRIKMMRKYGVIE